MARFYRLTTLLFIVLILLSSCMTTGKKPVQQTVVSSRPGLSTPVANNTAVGTITKLEEKKDTPEPASPAPVPSATTPESPAAVETTKTEEKTPEAVVSTTPPTTPKEETVPVTKTEDSPVKAETTQEATEVTALVPEPTKTEAEPVRETTVQPEVEAKDEPVALPTVVPTEPKEVVSQPEKSSTTIVKKTPFKAVDQSDIISAFNYAYGIQIMESLREQGICFIGSYFARGVLDAVEDVNEPKLVEASSIQNHVDDYIAEYMAMGIGFDSGKRPKYLEDIQALDMPAGIPEAFSYAYAYSFVQDLILSEVDIVADEFILGAMDVLYGEKRLFDVNETQRRINDYIIMLNEAYYAEQADLAETNRKKAEAFLMKNGARDEVKVLSNGIQIEILDEDLYLGAYPSQYDRVLVDYNMYTLDYETEDLMIIDADWGAEVSLSSASTSLRESLMAMRVGQAARTVVPPELGYGETGTDEIEPNTIIVYDIALNGIL